MGIPSQSQDSDVGTAVAPDDPDVDTRLPQIGAQVSTAGGILRAIERAQDLGAEVMQIFPSNPRRWKSPEIAPEETLAFRRLLEQTRLPLFVHTIYLINLASPDHALRRRSADALADALVFGSLAGAAGVVTHIGSHRGDGFETAVGRVREAIAGAQAAARAAIEAIESDTPRGGSTLPPLLLESSAGGGDSVGRDCDELSRLLDDLGGAGLRLGICLDTAHLFAAGLAVHTRSGLEEVLGTLRAHGHLERIELVHLNDCRSDFGSRADRHENLGDGQLGLEGLALAVKHPALRAVPFVLEVPGIGGGGPDRENMRRAFGLRGGAGWRV